MPNRSAFAAGKEELSGDDGMQAWRITGPERIERYEAKSGEVSSPSLVRVKIEQFAVSSRDIKTYESGNGAPIIPGRHGAGVVSEAHADDGFFEKSDRVVIDPYISCGECIDCKTGHPEKCRKKHILGVDVDGLQTDFITLPSECVHKIPQNVPFESAVFTEYVAMAINAIDKIDVQKGDHIAVLAANKIGNIMAQLIAYYQAIPIVIDESDEMLALAAEAGIPYTLNCGKTDVREEIISMTGGRLCEKVIYLTNKPGQIDVGLSVCSPNGIICAVGCEQASVTADFSLICRKQLSVCTIDSGSGAFPSAINLLATKAVKTHGLIERTVGFEAVPSVYENRGEINFNAKSVLVKE